MSTLTTSLWCCDAMYILLVLGREPTEIWGRLIFPDGIRLCLNDIPRLSKAMKISLLGLHFRELSILAVDIVLRIRS